MDSNDRFDCVIAGGGLAGGVAALALAALRPSARVALIEQAPRLGGNHTWSFHATELPDDARPWIDPLVGHQWREHTVIFPDGARRLAGGYASITSARFDRVVQARLDAVHFQVIRGDVVTEVAPGLVLTAAGRRLRAAVVLDARGLVRDGDDDPRGGPCGYQKFLGLEVELAADASLDGPLLMDATVPQTDGFRFVYVLPFAPRRLLVEDTTYADTAALDRPLLRQRVLDYLSDHGHQVVAVLREEAGVLPLPFGPMAGPGPAAIGAPLAIGYRGGWYHPLTGYSFSVAVHLATAIARADGPGAIAAAVTRVWARHARQAAFCRWLTRLMFTAVAPEDRWRLLARFYRLPAPTIARFYALRMTLADRLRLIMGPRPRWLSPRAAEPSPPAHASEEASGEAS